MINLLLTALQGKIKFTYGDTGKEIKDSQVLIKILEQFAALDLLVSQLQDEKLTAKS